MSDSDQAVLAHDFEVLLRYAAEQKVMLTPKQKFIPVRHVRNMMADFRVKEPHEEKVGERIYKKRWEMEYPRFYFLDLLALSGEFLTITRGGRLSKGSNWFGILELECREGKYSPELETVKLNPTGIDYFKRLDFGSKVLRSVSSWFSVN